MLISASGATVSSWTCEYDIRSMPLTWIDEALADSLPQSIAAATHRRNPVADVISICPAKGGRTVESGVRNKNLSACFSHTAIIGKQARYGARVQKTRSVSADALLGTWSGPHDSLVSRIPGDSRAHRTAQSHQGQGLVGDAGQLPRPLPQALMLRTSNASTKS